MGRGGVDCIILQIIIQVNLFEFIYYIFYWKYKSYVYQVMEKYRG